MPNHNLGTVWLQFMRAKGYPGYRFVGEGEGFACYAVKLYLHIKEKNQDVNEEKL